MRTVIVIVGWAYLFANTGADQQTIFVFILFGFTLIVAITEDCRAAFGKRTNYH